MRSYKLILCLLVFFTQPLIAMEPNDIEKEVLKISDSSYFKVNSSEFKSFDIDNKKNGVYVTLVTEKDSLWDNESRLNSHIKILRKTLNLCKFNLKGYLKVNIEANNNFERLLKSKSTEIPVVETKIFKADQQFTIPTVFLLNERRKYNTAKAFTDDFIERMARINKDVTNLTNTMWVSDNFEDYQNTPNALPSYSVIAHEVAHILGVYGHVYTKKPNIMNSIDIKGTKNFELNTEQCQAIKDKFEQDSSL